MDNDFEDTQNPLENLPKRTIKLTDSAKLIYLISSYNLSSDRLTEMSIMLEVQRDLLINSFNGGDECLFSCACIFYKN